MISFDSLAAVRASSKALATVVTWPVSESDGKTQPSVWVHYHVITPLSPPRFGMDSVAEYVSTCNRSRVSVTFNVDIDRSGLLSPKSLALLCKVRS